MTDPILKIDTAIFDTLLPGKTYLEASRIVKKYGYQIYCAVKDGCQSNEAWGNKIGNVYVEIRANQIYKVLRTIPIL